MEENNVKKTFLGWCKVSKNVYNGTGRLKWCVRESDGWIFLSDIDTSEYLADENNYEYCAFEKVIEIEPAVMGISRMPLGTDIQLCKELQKKFLSAKMKMWFADNETGKEIEIKDEEINYDGNAFHTWLNQK